VLKRWWGRTESTGTQASLPYSGLPFQRASWLILPARTANAAAMNVNLGIWDKLSKLMVFLLFVAGLLAVFFWYLPLIQQNQRYRKQLLTLEAKHAEEEKKGVRWPASCATATT
jgi:hypothetical protein